ncbi:MAG: TerC family protein [Cyanobacteriota bacterium]|jgi:YkoY family integral membrane protein
MFINSIVLNALGIFLSLFILETVLSADNAVALAALVQHLPNEQQQKQVLNWGLGGAFILRILLILAATWVAQFWQFQLVGSIYLLWLTGKYFSLRLETEKELEKSIFIEHENKTMYWQMVPMIAMTDLAFSLDSVTSAVALSDQTWLILGGGLMGVIALRFLAELFIQWLNQFTYLQDAAYLTIFWVGIRLLVKALLPNFILPEWLIITGVILLFTWGFSKRESVEIS